MRLFILAVSLFLLSLSAMSHADTETLQNDGFVSGQPANFQGGFIAGEIAAARFLPPAICPCILDSVTILYGGSPQTRTIGISVWDDPGGSTPGLLLFSGEVTLTGSTTNLQRIELATTFIPVEGPFRIGLEFNEPGLPSVATDVDGTIDSAANFILADVGGLSFWFPSATLGVSGDFIIRATVDNLTIADADADGVADDIDNCTNVPNPDQVDGDADGYGNRCDADFNDDCIVSVIDLGLLRTVFFETKGAPDWNPEVDLNLDGVINLIDLGIFRTLFFAPPGPSGTTEVCQ